MTDSNIPGCAPQCLPPGKTVPGSLPTGTYQTKYFFAKQMKLSFARGWFSEEDSTGEFAAYAKKNRDSRVVFWEDVYTTKPGSWSGSARHAEQRRVFSPGSKGTPI